MYLLLNGSFANTVNQYQKISAAKIATLAVRAKAKAKAFKASVGAFYFQNLIQRFCDCSFVKGFLHIKANLIDSVSLSLSETSETDVTFSFRYL